jgi:hypothetical protein
MQKLQPLAILHVGLFPWHILEMPRVDQADFKAGIRQDLPQRNPVDPGRFHRDPLNAALPKPLCDLPKIFGEAPKTPHWFLIPVRRNRHVDLGSPDVDSCSIGM